MVQIQMDHEEKEYTDSRYVTIPNGESIPCQSPLQLDITN